MTNEITADQLMEMAKKIKQKEMKNGECVGCLGKAYRKLMEERSQQ